MKSIKTLTLCLILVLSTVACNKTKTTSPPATETTKTEVAPVVAESEMKDINIGCAACVYEMEGMEGCSKAAAEIDGKPMLITGMHLEVHDMGLCSVPKKANVMGKVENGKLKASKVTLVAE